MSLSEHLLQPCSTVAITFLHFRLLLVNAPDFFGFFPAESLNSLFPLLCYPFHYHHCFLTKPRLLYLLVKVPHFCSHGENCYNIGSTEPYSSNIYIETKEYIFFQMQLTSTLLLVPISAATAYREIDFVGTSTKLDL